MPLAMPCSKSNCFICPMSNLDCDNSNVFGRTRKNTKTFFLDAHADSRASSHFQQYLDAKGITYDFNSWP